MVKSTRCLLQLFRRRHFNAFVFTRANYHRGGRGRTMATKFAPQNFDHFLVLDFEATCQEGERINPQEIIEFPILKVNAKTFETEATFHQYVQPQVHRELTPFCTELTGIIQEMVDGQPDITQTLKAVEQWLNDQGLMENPDQSMFVTFGDWDLKTMLPSQAKYFNLTYPDIMKRWINIKKAYSDFSGGQYPKGIIPALKGLGMEFDGRLHSGIDDCKNIARVLKAMGQKGYVFKMTGSLE